MQTTTYGEGLQNLPRNKKARKYTLIFSLVFAVILGMIFVGMLAGMVVSVDSVDGAWLMKLNKAVDSFQNELVIWRLFLSALLLCIYYQISKRKCRLSENKKPSKMALHMSIRIGAYLTLFELLVVQNLLGKAVFLMGQ